MAQVIQMARVSSVFQTVCKLNCNSHFDQKRATFPWRTALLFLLTCSSSWSPATAPPIKAITSPNPPNIHTLSHTHTHIRARTHTHTSLLPWRQLRRAGDALTGSRWFPVEVSMAEQCFHIHHKVSLYTHNFKVQCIRFSPLLSTYSCGFFLVHLFNATLLIIKYFLNKSCYTCNIKLIYL